LDAGRWGKKTKFALPVPVERENRLRWEIILGEEQGDLSRSQPIGGHRTLGGGKKREKSIGRERIGVKASLRGRAACILSGWKGGGYLFIQDVGSEPGERMKEEREKNVVLPGIITT